MLMYVNKYSQNKMGRQLRQPYKIEKAELFMCRFGLYVIMYILIFLHQLRKPIQFNALGIIIRSFITYLGQQLVNATHCPLIFSFGYYFSIHIYLN